jgi:hypothetical protein
MNIFFISFFGFTHYIKKITTILTKVYIVVKFFFQNISFIVWLWPLKTMVSPTLFPFSAT